MFKKTLALIIAVVVCGVIFIGCNNTEIQTPDNNDDANVTTPKAEVTVTEIHNAVKEAYGEEYLPNMPLDAEMFETVYGVKPEWVEEAVAETPMISFNVDTFIVVKPTEGNHDNVFNALNAYADILKNGSLQYPANEGKVKAVQCYSKGGFVFLYMLGVLPDDVIFAEGEAEEIFELQYQTALKNNQKATDAINAILGE